MTDTALATDPLLELLDGGALPTTDELMARLAEGNPRVAGVLRYLTMAEQARQHDDEEPEPEPPPEPLDTSALRDVVRRLHAEVVELRHRNDLLAAALGACHLCWGEDLTCSRCHGRGHPGALRPEGAAFAEWVLPAVRRAAAARRPAQPPDSPMEGAHQ